MLKCKDAQVEEKLEATSSASGLRREYRSEHRILGHKVCQVAFKKILGLGSGRFARLNQAARAGLNAPEDGRTLPKKLLLVSQKRSLQKRSCVVEFLEHIYNTMSEPMPEAKDCLKRKFAHEIEIEASKKPVPKKMQFRRLRGKRPKAARNLNRGHKDASALRVLPPGTFSEYLELLRAKYPGETFSLKLFQHDP